VDLQRADSPTRKTGYDLIAVRKGEDIVNIDAMAPNRVFAEWVRGGNFLKDLQVIRPETIHGDSRFDFYLEGDGRRVFVEVKGVTLEENGHLLFPDAPTQRGVKHVKGLEKCVSEGYEAVCFFVIQMQKAVDFAPNARTHPEFARALKHAAQNGVQIMAMNCTAEPDRLELDRAIKVLL